jgi:acyl-homoserine-lactone acylase
MDAYGATLVGIPVLAIAFNNNLGWTHTVNTFDGWDLYDLTLSGEGYLFDGEVRDFERKTTEIKVRQEDGIIRTEELTTQSSIHGAVIQQKEGKALALRVVGLDRPGVLKQWWDMAKANNFSEFETALQRLQLPMFTVMYADREGHIMHLFNGQVPIRDRGDFAYWSGVIPGDTSDTLWTKIHPYEDLPRIVDPQSGWLQNANDPPWTTTFPRAIASEDYPAYIAPHEMYFRPQNSARMLAASKISLEEMMAYKHSTRMEMADRLLDDLLPALRQEASPLALKIAGVLEKWDRQANAESQGAVLFAAWLEETDFDTLFSQPWQENSPLDTPDGLANPQQAVTTLLAVAAKIEQDYGAIDVPWGEVFRLQQDNIDLPANGGPGYLGIFRVVNFMPRSDEKHFQAFDGDSFVAAIEFSQPVKAMALTTYGNSTQPNSNKSEQLKLFAQKQLRPIWRSRSEVETHSVQHEKF